MPPRAKPRLCIRCNRPYDRLVRQSVCVPCYNREREYLSGKNARGHKPIRLKPVAMIAVTVGNRQTLVCATSPTEAVAALLAAHGGAIAGRGVSFAAR